MALKTISELQKKLTLRTQAALGQIPCDTVLRNARFLNVFTLEWQKGDLSIYDGVIVGTEAGLKGQREFDLKGKYLAPGFIDAHVHLESSMMVPHFFEGAVLPKGTTSAICDPHELANVMGVPGIEFFLQSASKLALDLKVMVPSCVPATHLETNGGGTLLADQLAPFLSQYPEHAWGLAEMMNVPGVLHSDPTILDKLTAFRNHPRDGHSPLLRGAPLSAYLVNGITSCHECSELPEAREKIEKGMSVWIREGSVAKDLEALAPLLNIATSTSLGFCTDDRNPLDIQEEGHIDHLVRQAARILGAQGPELAALYRAASWSVARHYGLDRGYSSGHAGASLNLDRIGALAPGFQADLIVLEDPVHCGITRVMKKGRWIEEIAFQSSLGISAANSIRIGAVTPSDLTGPTGQVHVIEVIPGKIITGRSVRDSAAAGVAKLCVLERYGHGSKPANAYVAGFGEQFSGAIGSSVGHDSHNLIAVGSTARDQAVALAALQRNGGGFCVVKDGNVLAELALPVGGLMSEKSPAELSRQLQQLKAASQSIGCALSEPFLQLAFLSLPVIPSLKLTDKGLVDVDQFQIISVRAS